MAAGKSARDLVLRNLEGTDGATCMLRWNHRPQDFADQLETQLREGPAYVLDREAVALLLKMSSKLDEAEFFRAIANVRLPFPKVWLEIDAILEEGQIEPVVVGRMGALFSQTEEGIEVFSALAIGDQDVPGQDKVPLLAGTLVRFRPDGQVECEDTDVAWFYDKMEAAAAGRAAGFAPEDPAFAEAEKRALKQRESEDITRAIKLSAVMMMMSSLMNGREEILRAEMPQPPSKQARKILTRAGRTPPDYAISKVSLGRMGALYLREEPRETEDLGGEDRSRARPIPHWVRGHHFLARNGKLTWRSGHVRGGKKAERTLTIVTA